MLNPLTLRGTLPRLLSLGLLVSALTLSGAVPSYAQEVTGKEPPKEATKEKAVVKLRVDNANFLGVHIYAIRDGYIRSLGFVEGLARAELTLPEVFVAPIGEFRVLADPLGSRVGYLSDPVLLGTSKEVDLTVENQLEFSHVTVR